MRSPQPRIAGVTGRLIRPRSIGALLAGAVVALTIGCGGGTGQANNPTGDPPRDRTGGIVLVFAASSLTDAFGAIEAAIETTDPSIDVQLNLAGSANLREQVLAGAPADVFASADQLTMTDVVDAAETTDDPRVFATNRLQIAVPQGNPGQVSGLADLADPDLLIGLCAQGVPCGRFGRQALERAGVDAAVDTDEPDVRSLLTKIAADELDAGLVYVTDVAAQADQVVGIELDPAHNIIAPYPIAPLRGGSNPEGGARFIDFVHSPEGQAILADHGFGKP